MKKIRDYWQEYILRHQDDISKVPYIEQPFAACDRCDRISYGRTNERYQIGDKTLCEACIEELDEPTYKKLVE